MVQEGRLLVNQLLAIKCSEKNPNIAGQQDAQRRASGQCIARQSAKPFTFDATAASPLVVSFLNHCVFLKL